jgi:hypothetical protein
MTVPAMSESDIEKGLNHLSILKPLQAGEIECRVCGKNINLDNLALMSRVNETVLFSCDDRNCMLAFNEILRSISGNEDD